MAEIGSLSVSLSLDANSFNGSISQVDRNLRAMGSELKAVKAQGADYGKSLDGLKTKKDILSRSVEAAGIKLNETRKKYDEMVASGKASEVQLERQAKKVNDAQTQYNRLETELKDVEKELKQVDEALKKQNSSWTQMSDKLAPIGDKLKSVGSSMTNFGKDLSMKVTAPIVALGTGAFKAAVDFESAFAGVRKTVDGSEADFKKLETGIRDMAKEIPAATTEIAGVAEAAGQLGIEKESILGFTRTMIDLGVATNMTSEQAATDLARLANITQMPQSEFKRLGSSVVALGNTMATTESEIVSMSLRLAAQGAQVGMSEAQITALAATMSSLGIEAEAGGTAMTTVLKKIQTAVGNGGKELEAFARASGVSSQEFKQAWEKDAVVALDMFIKGLSTSGQEGKNLTTILGNLGISGIRESDTLLRMAGASDLLADAVKTSTSAWDENNALTNEAKQRYETTASQIKILWNDIKDLGIEIGGALIPIIKDGIDTVKPWIQAFADADDKTKKLILTIGGLVAAAGPLLVIAGSIMSSIGGLVTTVSALSGVVATAGGASAVFGGALTALTGPVGLTVAAIAGLTATGVALYNHLKDESIPEVERFSDEVSESTQKVVGSFLDLNDQATVTLNELKWSGRSVSEEMKEVIVTNFDQMGTQVVNGLEEKKNEAVNVMQELFNNTTTITEEEQAEMLASVQQGYDDRISKTQEGTQRINEIMEIASSENRALTRSEQLEINQIQDEMVKKGIEVLSENQREQKVIFERMKQNASDLSALQAAEVVKNSVEQKEKVIQEAEDQYNQSIAEIIRLRDEAGAISEDQANKLIQEAERQKNETISNAEEMHQNVISEAQAQANEHVNHVNWETGEVLSKWQVFKNNTAQNWNEMVESTKVYWSNMGNNIKTKVDEMRSNTAQNWSQMVSNAKTNWSNMTNDIKQRAEDIRSNAVSKLTQLRDSAGTRLQETKDKMLKPINEARDSIGKAIDKVKSFFSNMSLKFPSISMPKLPRFTLKGEFSLNPPSVPKLSIDWYAKGAIFTKPTIFNTPYGLKGFGEAGPEAALPLNDQVLGTIGKMIAETMKGNGSGGDINQHITINSPKHLDPYETARLVRNAAKELALQ